MEEDANGLKHCRLASRSHACGDCALHARGTRSGPTARPYDGAEGTLVVAMLVVVGVVQLVVVRFLVLPGAISNPDATEEQTTILAYSFPQSAASYGLVASITTGNGFVALPLGAIAPLSWLVVRAYLQDSYADDRRSRMRDHRR